MYVRIMGELADVCQNNERVGWCMSEQWDICLMYVRMRELTDVHCMLE